MEQEAPSSEDRLEADEIGELYARLRSEPNPEAPLCVRLSEEIRELCQDCEPFEEDDPRRQTVLLVEDDPYVAEDYASFLEAHGFSVCLAYSPEEAFFQAERYRKFTVAVLDIRMHSAGLFGRREHSGGQRTGLVLAQELVQQLSDSLFFALTNSTDAHVDAWFSAQAERGFHFCNKSDYPPVKFARLVKLKVQKHIMEKPLGLKTFIVHGHDQQAVLELKNYVQSRLKFPEPIVLHEKPSGTNTIIEKFEKYAKDIDVAFVILTPDDLIDPAGGLSGRARQNVLFELGYFVGQLGRKSGRIILLTKKGVEIPSDLFGVIYIDITDGVNAAGEKIRLELEALV